MGIYSIVTNNYVNDTRVYKTSNTLQKFGFQVTIIALHKNGLSAKEVINGITINRVKLLTKTLPKFKFIQLVKYAEFIFKCFYLLRNRAKYVICNDLDTLPIGYLIYIFSNKPVKIVYDCHEYETERDGMSKLTRILLKYFEKTLIKCTKHIFCVSNSIADCYVNDYSIRKPKLVLNCPYYTELPKEDLFRKKFGLRKDQKVFLYQGGLKSGRGVEMLVEAFSLFNSDSNVIVFMGFGPLKDIIINASKVHKTIFFHQAVHSNTLLKYTSSADFGILFYEDTCLNHRYCSPNKVFEYLMAGLPVLSSKLLEMNRLVNKEGVGIVSSENTVKGLIDAVKKCLELDYTSTQNNVFIARKKYCWEEQAKVFLSAFTPNN